MTDASKTPHYLLRDYDLTLPVFKQGSDLAGHLHGREGQEEHSPRDAFEAMARQYDEAAAQCRRMAGVAAEIPELRVNADAHHIGVNGPAQRLDALVVEGLLSVSPDEEFDETWTETALTEQLFELKDGKGPFSVEDAVREIAAVEADLAGLNPVWVREVFERSVTEGSLVRSGDLYEVAPDEDEINSRN
jgi:hypothetical protein